MNGRARTPAVLPSRVMRARDVAASRQQRRRQHDLAYALCRLRADDHLRARREQRRRVLVVGDLEFDFRRLEPVGRRRVQLEKRPEVAAHVRLDPRADPRRRLAVAGIADQQIAKRELLAAQLPGIDLANHPAAATRCVDDAEAQRVVAGLDDDFTEIVARRVLSALGYRKRSLGEIPRDDLAVGVEQDVADRELLGLAARLTDLRRDHDPCFVAGGILLRERGDAHRHFRHPERRLQRVEQGLLGVLPRRRCRREHEGTPRPHRHVAPAHRHVNPVRLAVTVAGRFLDAEHVIGERLAGKAIEDQLTGADDVVQRAAGSAGEVGQARDCHVAVFRHRRAKLTDGDVVARDVHQQHVDGDAGHRRRADDGVEVARRVENQSFRHQDERLRTFDHREREQQVVQAAQRVGRVLARAPHQVGRFAQHVALALLASEAGHAGALPEHDLAKDPGVGFLRNRDRFRQADVELALKGGLLADDAFHPAPDAQVVVGERHLHARLGERDERHPVGRTQTIEELGGRRQQGPRAAEADVALVDGDHNLPAVWRLEVGGVQRLERIGRFAPRRFHVDLHVLRRDHATGLPVDLDDEIGRQEVLDRHALPIDHRHVNRDDVDAGSERRTLGRRLRLLAGGQRDGTSRDSQYEGEQLLHGFSGRQDLRTTGYVTQAHRTLFGHSFCRVLRPSQGFCVGRRGVFRCFLPDLRGRPPLHACGLVRHPFCRGYGLERLSSSVTRLCYDRRSQIGRTFYGFPPRHRHRRTADSFSSET